MKRFLSAVACLGYAYLCLVGDGTAAPMQNEEEAEDYRILREIIAMEFSDETPHEWGAAVSGVKTRLKTEEKVIALGLDACDPEGRRDSLNLLRALELEGVPVTLFVCGDWIDRNAAVFKKIAANPLFEIGNQGLARRPCSVNGRSIGTVPGTRSVEELFAEIEKNARKIEAMTGTLPQYYHAGTGYYDEVAVRIVNALGYDAVGSELRLPEGTALTREEVFEALMSPAAGAIAVLQPLTLGRATSEAVLESVRRLKTKGYKFVKLSDFPLE
ncbi:MAG: polysaccharide deacetylase family protein [Candidatus Omnitrophica bacterium]|nr:polysaccharide deacetylase family protein [Candidatus Omnitrophota bacterium]